MSGSTAFVCSQLPGFHQHSQPVQVPLISDAASVTSGSDNASGRVHSAPSDVPFLPALLAITGGLAVSRRMTRQTLSSMPDGGKLRARSRRLATIQSPLGGQPPELDSKTLFRHFDDEWPLQAGVYFGGERVPLVFAISESEQLAAYLRNDPLGPFAHELDWPDVMLSGERQTYENELDAPYAPGRWKDWGFQFSGKEQYLLKADWHSVHGWGKTLDVFVPRKALNKPCQIAPPRTVAFVESFREINRPCWQMIVDGIHSMKVESENNPDRQRLLDMLLETFGESGHFAAIEVQAGPAVRNHSMCWHRDGPAGLLHLAVTLGGSRNFRFRSPNETHEIQSRAGGFYLSSPFLFEHGVEYHKAREETGPLLTLMCRFGFLDQSDALWAGRDLGTNMWDVTELIANCLKECIDSGSLRLPSMQEVQACEDRYQEQPCL
eukprot:TRINITY_DN48952_c0_g1_i1.p1 TRINITY_DN48952_c0_g1~~TRINITY_DN48952_c0_g1_i1.p1  ORF type:complete len:436 (-),score=57.39 TRINITY_DN48952_c0_g1_i1:38-1345(-)